MGILLFCSVLKAAARRCFKTCFSGCSALPPSRAPSLFLPAVLSAPLPGSCCSAVAVRAQTFSEPGRGLPFSLWGAALSTLNWFFESFFQMCLHLCRCCCSPAFGEEPPRSCSLLRRRPPLAESCPSIPTERSREPAPTTTVQSPGHQLGPGQHVQGGGQKLPEQKFPQQRFPCQTEQVSATPLLCLRCPVTLGGDEG